MYEYQASLIKVVDGDTVHLAVDLGCDVTIKMDVRLAHINAPEISTDAGKAAKTFVADWFSTHPLLHILTLKDRREKYGRYLAEIYPGPGGATFGVSLNQELLNSGNAVAYEGGAR